MLLPQINKYSSVFIQDGQTLKGHRHSVTLRIMLFMDLLIDKLHSTTQ